MSIRAYS